MPRFYINDFVGSISYFIIISIPCLFPCPSCLAPRCVQLLAKEHLYKLVAGHKVPKRPRQDDPEPEAGNPPGSVPKAKAKSKAKAKAGSKRTKTD